MKLLNPLPQRLDTGATATFAGLLAGDGTAAAPSISFAADTDTGFYRDTSNLVGFTAGGASSLRFGSAGTIYGASNANYVRLNNSGGVELAAAGTNQNITLTPSGSGSSVLDSVAGQELSVLFRQNGSTKGSLITSGGDVLFGTTGATNLIFTTSGAEKARFFANGRIGIGTGNTDSGALLQVGTNTTTSAGGIVFGTDTTIFRSAAGAIRFGGTQTTLAFDMGAVGYTAIANASGGGSDIRFLSAGSTELRTNGALALTLDSSQNATFAALISPTGTVTGSAANRWLGTNGASNGWFINAPTGGEVQLGVANNNAFSAGANFRFGNSTAGTSAVGVIVIANGTAPTTSPAGSGQLYVESGALKFRGSGGTVTTVANA
jgi:hypothetical protein